MIKPRAPIPLDVLRLMLKDIKKSDHFKKLNDFEHDFIGNIEELVYNNFLISVEQYKIFNRIYEKATELD